MPNEPVVDDDEAIKRAEYNRRLMNDGEGRMSAEAQEHELFRIKAEARRHKNARGTRRPDNRMSSADRSSSHRLLDVKASISSNRSAGRESIGLDSHHFSIESFVDDDQQPVEIEDSHTLLQAKGYIRNSQHTLSVGDDTASRDSLRESSGRDVVEWVNNDADNMPAYVSRPAINGADGAEWEDMEQAISASLPPGQDSDLPIERSESAPPLTAVIVDEEGERERFALESSQSVARGAVQAEVVDVKKRRIVVGSLIIFAVVVIGSLVAAVTATSKQNKETDSPTMAPTMRFVESFEWVAIANEISLSGTNLTYPAPENATTSEQALAWLIDEDEDVAEQRAVQRFAFVVMAYSWENQTAWNITPGFDECELDGVTCDAENSCTSLDMQRLDLRGTIPPEIALLTDMRKIVFLSNKLSGTVPWEPMMKNLDKLEYLDLDVNELTGPLPSPEPGSWPLLEIFWTAWNQFTGTISSGFAHWPRLEDLYVSDNFLTGTLPTELGKISAMNWFAVDDNIFQGTLPTELGDWTKINHFQVEASMLTGTIPTEVGRWSEIKDFFAYSNNFNGTLPSEIGDWPNIIWMRTEFNDMTGPLPSGMSSWTQLTALGLNNNAYTGPLPSGMTNWTKLRDIQINDNRFSGEIPLGLDSLEDLTLGAFQVNDFTGSLEELCENATSTRVVLSADCCEVDCPCCSSCFVDDGSPDGNCTGVDPEP